jgi:hypothetical protein
VSVLRVLVDRSDLAPPLTSLCAGYEQGEWRVKALADEMANALPDFALSYAERQSFNSSTGMSLVRRAGQLVYSTKKYGRRGEFGELLLHVLVSRLFQTEPAISKIYFKDSPNDTVKGFDCVHIVATPEMELWLGEVKFYTDRAAAIRDVIDELVKHSDRDYLRTEFLMIVNKIDPAWPHAEALRRLLHESKSLDEVFPRIRIPVLITYDSDVVASHSSWEDPYLERFTLEVLEGHSQFAKKLKSDIFVHLILVPLASKQNLVNEMHQRLASWKSV